MSKDIRNDSMDEKITDTSFFLSVADFISHHSMIKQGDSVLLGVSGGADSMALLHALQYYRKFISFSIGIAHLNHSLRGEESARDHLFVKQIAKTLKLPFYYGCENVKAYQKKNKLSLEEAARKVRYNFLFSAAKNHGCNKIATGHHADDNAELVLMNLIRGSGPVGLGGMHPVSRRGRIIRPLLDQTKEETEHFLNRTKIPFIYDSSNSDTAFLRNKIRLDLLPDLQKLYNHNISKTLNRTAAIIREDEDWLQSAIKPLIAKMLNKKKDGTVEVSIEELKDQHVSVRRRLYRQAIEHVKGDLRGISLSHTDAIGELTQSAKAHTSIDLPGRIRVKKTYDSLTFIHEEKNLRSAKPAHSRAVSTFHYSVKRPFAHPETLIISEVNLKLRFTEIRQDLSRSLSGFDKTTALLDMNRVDFPIIVRNVLPGDRFTPIGMKGTQKLNKFFINNRISIRQRNICPVVLSGEKIIWVAGHRIDDGFKVLEQTKNILKVELLLA